MLSEEKTSERTSEEQTSERIEEWIRRLMPAIEYYARKANLDEESKSVWIQERCSLVANHLTPIMEELKECGKDCGDDNEESYSTLVMLFKALHVISRVAIYKEQCDMFVTQYDLQKTDDGRRYTVRIHDFDLHRFLKRNNIIVLSYSD